MREDFLDNFSFEDVMDEVEKDRDISKKNDAIVSNNEKIEFKIEKDFGRLSDNKYAPSFTIMSWKEHKCYDLRHWLDDDKSKPGKGITLSVGEVRDLKNCLIDMDFDCCNNILRIYKNGKAKAIFYKRLSVLHEYLNKNRYVWRKEVNLIDWGTGIRLDIRKWNDEYTRCSKGITLKDNEIIKLREILDSMTI